jgi:predicted unusual protein kinase regulating ubiquinone biosynthesis (AarF/ABC1/UbiB family)
VLQPIPRRSQVITPSAETVAPVTNLRPLRFRADVARSIRRLLQWTSVVAAIVGGTCWDLLRRRDSTARRAERLRRGLEEAGGTFVKFGQQIAMRIDLVPWEYCVELSKMLDRVPPFPVEDALAAVERTTGRPWQDVFAVFDPEPVGSASIACVYQAVLKDGRKVAVKIRRPGIGDVFMADLRVLDWMFKTAEFLTLVRPGFTANLRRELRETLLEELDFRREAHYQDIFRRNARRTSGKSFFTAPRVHFELSNDEVMVQEFASGMWLWELLAAVEQRDPRGLAIMRELNIEPRRVARRILWAAFWSMDEHIFFHADPHPANIVVGRDSTLTFVDFGSCGSFNDDQRSTLQRVTTSMLADDAEGMARASLRLLEPLPRVDVPSLMKDLEHEYVGVLSTFRTRKKHTAWWERTSARLWLAMMRISRRHDLPVNLHTLRMIRATLLYDTLVLRLDPKTDRYRSYMRFRHRDKVRWARKRWNQRWRDARRDLFLRVEELANAGDDLMSRAEQAMASPILSVNSVIGKGVFAFSVMSRTLWQVVLITGIAAALTAAAQALRTGTVPIADSLQVAAQNRVYWLAIAVVLVLNTRQILFRLRDREEK